MPYYYQTLMGRPLWEFHIGEMDRHWIFVRNNYTDADEHAVFALTLEAQAVVCGREVGEKCHTPHLQGAVSFKEMKSGKQIQEMLPGFEHEPKAKKSLFTSFYSYCEKGEQPKPEWEELGVKGPNFGKNADVFAWGDRSIDRGDAQKIFWRSQLEAVRKRKFDDLDPKVAALNLRHLEHAISVEREWAMDLQPLVGAPSTYCEWHYGVPDSGKTYYASLFPQAFVWNKEAGWNKYKGQDVVIFSDIDADSCPSINQVKTWADPSPFAVKVLYEVMNIRPKRLIYTSNDTIRDCWPRAKPLHYEAVLRRFAVYHYTQPYWLDKERTRTLAPVSGCSGVADSATRVYGQDEVAAADIL